jgi:CHAT domain-containing protein/Tfp pilus assembly protein PilF
MNRIRFTNHLLFILIFIAFADRVWAQDPEKDAALGTNYYQKGIEFKNQFELDSADFYLTKAAELFKKNEDWDNYLIISNESGIVMLQKGKIADAITFYNKLISLSVEKIGDMNEYQANLFNNLGKAYFMKGGIDAALELYDKSLAIRIKMKDQESLFASDLFNDMGNAYTEKGEIDLALDYYQKSLSIRLKLLGENNPQTAISYNNLGIVYREQAKYDEAIKYHQKAIEIQKAIYGENYPELANYYQGIGNVYKDKREFDPAMEYYQKAYSIRKKAFTENHPLTAKDMINIAIIYSEKGDTENALNYFQTALNIQKKVLQENHPDLAITYNNLGNIYNEQKQYDLALAFYINALDIKKTAVGESNPEVADYLNNIGNIYSAKGDYEQALDYIKKSLDIKVRFYGQKHPAVVLPYLSMGNIYYGMGDYNMALQYFQRSLASNVKDFNPEPTNIYFNPIIANYYNAEVLLRSLRGKAKALVGSYKANNNQIDLFTALTTYQKCDTLISIIRSSSISKNDKIEIGRIAAEIYDQAIDVCFNLDQIDKEKEKDFYLTQAFYFSEKNKAGALLEALAASDASKFSGIPDNLLDLEKSYNTQISFYEKKLAETYDEQTESTLRNGLFKVKRDYDKLISDFEKNYPKYYEMKYSKANLIVKQIQDVLDDNTALRTYFIGDSLISIFTILKNGILMEKSPKDKNFDEKIFQFRKHITSNTLADVKNYVKEAHIYYNVLFPGKLPEQIKRLVIIPDGVLGMIPFETLLTEEYTGKLDQFGKYPYLIKRFEISYNYATTLFYKQLKRQSNGANGNINGWLGIAPVFNNSKDLIIDGNEITPLPGSETEINTIKKKFEEKNLKTNAKLFSEASEQFMKTPELKQYKYIHIATHGFVNSDKPELSGIILSEDKAGNNDGVLYTGEIYNLTLNSDLVVLSACETGLGKVSKGEGIIGLTRALLYAGTKDIIVSLWKVADISTSELMIDFYDNLLEKEGSANNLFLYSEALHKAKLLMLDKKEFSHPFFWSPFILVGQ